MTSVRIITSALQRIKDIRMAGAGKYKGKTNVTVLSNIERRVQVATPKASGKGMLTNWRGQKESHVRARDKFEPSSAHTSWSTQTERRVRTQKCKQAGGTHILEKLHGETNQDTESMQASKGNSQPGEHIWREESGHGKNASQQGALTSWRA